MTKSLDDRAAQFFLDLQDRITTAIEQADGGARFREDAWTRPTGGGGRTRVLADGKTFEKAGVAFSDVHGTLRPEMARALPGDGDAFRATGISLIFHPRSPRIPTVHANVRHIQRGGAGGAGGVGWFGGGADLTPYYVVPADAVHFHQTLASAASATTTATTPASRAGATTTSFSPTATRRAASAASSSTTWARARRRPRAGGRHAAVVARGRSGGDVRVRARRGRRDPGRLPPIVERRRADAWGERERRWQTLRRGRYVEFNLLYDRGTVFGLHTDGRVESILMSLPPEVRWEYAFAPEAGTPEAESLAAIVAKRDWAGLQPASAGPSP